MITRGGRRRCPTGTTCCRGLQGQDARSGLAADAPDVRRRIDDLIRYVRYAELRTAHEAAKGDARQKARDAVMELAYRIRKTEMVHSYGLWCRTRGPNAADDPDHPLKNDRPVAEGELLEILCRVAVRLPASRPAPG